MSYNWFKALTSTRIALSLMVGALSGLLLADFALNGLTFHSHLVTLNYYTNGTADWSIDITVLIRTIFILMFLIFGLGVGLGLVIGKKK